MIYQKIPPDVYDDWKSTISSIQIVLHNANKNNLDSLPDWSFNLSIEEISAKINLLISENNLQYTLNMIASIEGLFIHQINYYKSNKSKIAWQKSLRKKYKRIKEKIIFDKLLEDWKKAFPDSSSKISKLKEYLNYRHWLAHGRYWSIQYRNIPDPDNIFMLYSELNRIINFNLAI